MAADMNPDEVWQPRRRRRDDFTYTAHQYIVKTPSKSILQPPSDTKSSAKKSKKRAAPLKATPKSTKTTPQTRNGKIRTRKRLCKTTPTTSPVLQESDDSSSSAGDINRTNKSHDLSPHHAPPTQHLQWQPDGMQLRSKSDYNELDVCLSVYENTVKEMLESTDLQPFIKNCLIRHRRLTVKAASTDLIHRVYLCSIADKKLMEEEKKRTKLLFSVKKTLCDIEELSKRYVSSKKKRNDQRHKQLMARLNLL